MAKRATVVLGHKTKIYKGDEQSQFVGKVTINRKDYLISISADGDRPKLYESRKDNTPIMYANVIPLGEKSERKRRNEL